MNNLYDLLSKIKEKPALYLGTPSAHNLYMFLLGYKLARHDLGVPQTEQELEFQKFQYWVQKRMKINATVSWDKIISLYSTSERDSFDRFFELFEEFLNRNKDLDSQ
jgi:hypothetical protein